MRYFAKSVPKTPLWLTDNRKLVFETIDREMGYFATDDPFMMAEMDSFIRTSRGGVREITLADYESFLKKKGTWTPLPPPSDQPESFSPGHRVPDTFQPSAVPAAIDAIPVPMETAINTSAPVQRVETPAEAPKPVTPRVGRRRIQSV